MSESEVDGQGNVNGGCGCFGFLLEMNSEKAREMQEKIVPFEPMKVNFDFPHYAVCIAEDFSRLDIIPAHIHPAQTVEREGIVPGTDRFDKYADEIVSVTVDLDGLAEADIIRAIHVLGAILVIADKPNIYQASCRAAEVDKLLASKVGFIGFFQTSDAAISEIESERNDYLSNLQRKINAAFAMGDVINLFVACDTARKECL